MSDRPFKKDIEMLTAARDRLLTEMRRLEIPSSASALQRFDPAPNRGRMLPFQARPFVRASESMREGPINCSHGVDWTTCAQCSKSVH
jgi:hypothetical protein